MISKNLSSRITTKSAKLMTGQNGRCINDVRVADSITGWYGSNEYSETPTHRVRRGMRK
jgi:hypothetical protein